MRRFGRNVALEAAYGETDTLLTPNPRDVSNSLMARDIFKPATSVNFIATAWIQFMVHDWVSHGDNVDADPIVFDLPPGDVLGEGSMSVDRTRPDPSRTDYDAGLPPTYQNENTHWWDGSQLYGSDKATNDKVRAFVDGKLKINSDNTLPTELLSGVPITGFNDNWWVGLSMLHQLFTLEHNAIAEQLKAAYPDKDDQWLYDKARLINAALMAKIHTVEWTPAIINNPVTVRGMRGSWWGLLDNRESRDSFQAAAQGLADYLEATGSPLYETMNEFNFVEHAIAGLVGSREPENSGVPYTLTEEFVAVYRMHPLLRDSIDVLDIGSNTGGKNIPIQATRNGDAEDLMASEGAERLWYSFGVSYPGSLSLKNYPNFLRDLSIPFKGNIDLAAIDIIRDRERGIPRYNEFRRRIGLNPINRFEDLTSDAEILAQLKRLYNNDVEQIDALVGQLAETVRPDGFAFGETAFQVFIMNASRRLMTDRFYTKDYTPEIYTAEGLDWVENNSMIDVLTRHYPELTLSLASTDNAFQPWGLNIGDDYQQWSACEKQKHLWENGALRSQYHGQLPALSSIDPLGLIGDILTTKVSGDIDVAPAGYQKPIHANGALAKVKFEAEADSPYSGLFKGSECGLLRLSVTGDPSDRGFAPGLAWKAFVDGQPSENVSALYTLSGQGDNYDFFANELSQYVSPELNATLVINAIYSAVTSKPTWLRVDAMAEVEQDGSAAAAVKAPTQIYFVPSEAVKGAFASSPHDFREDLTTLAAGTQLYDVYATDMQIKSSIWPKNAAKYAAERRASAVKIGELVLDSKFTTSTFGDSSVFFKHQRYED